MTPTRIQLRRTKGWRMPENTVHVARPTKFGNPFTVNESVGATAELAVDEYRRCLRAASLRGLGWTGWAQRVLDGLPELRGKNLACWCPLTDKDGRPVPCHADVLLELANGGDA